MITTELPLFSEDKFITPLEAVLHEATPKAQYEERADIDKGVLKKSLDDLFPEQRYEEKDIQRAKEILGQLAEKFSNQELLNVITDIQFLVNNWLDDFERKTFNGLTLKKLLHEKGGI